MSSKYDLLIHEKFPNYLYKYTFLLVSNFIDGLFFQKPVRVVA
jgi:hypothetical protein